MTKRGRIRAPAFCHIRISRCRIIADPTTATTDKPPKIATAKRIAFPFAIRTSASFLVPSMRRLVWTLIDFSTSKSRLETSFILEDIFASSPETFTTSADTGGAKIRSLMYAVFLTYSHG